MLALHILGVGLWGPGLAQWSDAQSMLLAPSSWTPNNAMSTPPATLLPSAERRRATLATRLALSAAQQALTQAKADAHQVAAVFASSSGSADVIHDICSMLAENDDQISPTKFHNSVHNAASGYYSIAVGSHRPTTSVCAYDDSAPIGLLEAAVQASTSRKPVLFVSFDTPYPFPLSAVRPIADGWACALLLATEPGTSPIAQCHLSTHPQKMSPETHMQDLHLENARVSNPTARLLPLLTAIARRDSSQPQTVCFTLHNQPSIQINIL